MSNRRVLSYNDLIKELKQEGVELNGILAIPNRAERLRMLRIKKSQLADIRKNSKRPDNPVDNTGDDLDNTEDNPDYFDIHERIFEFRYQLENEGVDLSRIPDESNLYVLCILKHKLLRHKSVDVSDIPEIPLDLSDAALRQISRQLDYKFTQMSLDNEVKNISKMLSLIALEFGDLILPQNDIIQETRATMLANYIYSTEPRGDNLLYQIIHKIVNNFVNKSKH